MHGNDMQMRLCIVKLGIVSSIYDFGKESGWRFVPSGCMQREMRRGLKCRLIGFFDNKIKTKMNKNHPKGENQAGR